MLLFEIVSDDVVLHTGSFARMTALAGEQRRRGVRVIVRRARTSLPVSAPRGRTVHVFGSHTTDLLHCLDAEDALATLRAARAAGLRAEIVKA